jgi:hypothetical protein
VIMVGWLVGWLLFLKKKGSDQDNEDEEDSDDNDASACCYGH